MRVLKVRYVLTYAALRVALLRFTEMRCAFGTSCNYVQLVVAALFIAFGPSVNCNVFQWVHTLRCASKIIKKVRSHVHSHTLRVALHGVALL